MPNEFAIKSTSKMVLLTALLLFVSGNSVIASTPNSDLIARAKRGVVLITTYDRYGQPEKQGSGFFLTNDRVATNSHVVETASRIQITTANGKSAFASSIIALDKASDLALLQLGAPILDATPLSLADVTPDAGEPVLLVSNPAGERGTVSFGLLGPAWKFVNFGERLQITAKVSAGSSGGPVLDLDGRVIAIAVMHVESAENLSFAIPVERLRSLQSGADFMLNAIAGRAGSRQR